VSATRRSGGGTTCRAWLWVAVVLINLPIALVVVASFSDQAFISFPPRHFSLRWYAAYVQSDLWLDATLNSIRIAALTALLSTVLGVAASFGLTRGRFPGRHLLNAVVAAPLIVPTVVVAIALYFTFARLALVGTTTAIVLAHTALAAPLVVVCVNAGLQGLDETLEQAARGLGAGRLQTFWLISRPLLQPAILTGALFAFLVSFDELVVALFVAGVGSETLPMRMWTSLNNEIDPTIAAVSTVLITLSAAAILVAGIGGMLRASSGSPDTSRDITLAP